MTIFSTKGYTCVREVDFVESTSACTFHPAGCIFEIDQFAHMVQEEDKRNQKQDGWYSKMRGEQNALRHAIDEAVKKK